MWRLDCFELKVRDNRVLQLFVARHFLHEFGATLRTQDLKMHDGQASWDQDL